LSKLSRAGRMIKFVEEHTYVPEGKTVGQNMIMLPEQKEFVTRIYNNLRPDGRLLTRTAIKSIARKNGKTAETSPIMQAHIFGPEAKQNSQVYSAARSRDQAALLFNYMAKSIRMNPRLEGLVKITDSRKEIHGLARNVLYKALSADASTKHGLSPALCVFDEAGQIIGADDALVEALESAFGAQDEPLSIYISTQAASDTDLFSILIDDALRANNPEIVLALYAAGKDDDIYDEAVWFKANYALGKFRSIDEFRNAAEKAKRIPSFENTFRNLYLNQRVSLLSLLLAPTVWRENGEIQRNEDLFYGQLPVHLGLDLSARNDLSACVGAVENPETGFVQTKTWVFTPLNGLEERARRDKAPYVQWVRDGYLIALPGNVIDYEQIVQYLQQETHGMNIASVNFDRWRIDMLKKEAIEYGWAQGSSCVWKEFGQGFRDMSPAIETLTDLVANRMLAHGAHPLLNLGAANAVVVQDAAGNKKIDKSKTSARIDPLVAAIMAVHACVAPPEGKEIMIQHTANDLII